MTPNPNGDPPFSDRRAAGFCACLRKSVHGDTHPLFRGRKCGRIKRYEYYNTDF